MKIKLSTLRQVIRENLAKILEDVDRLNRVRDNYGETEFEEANAIDDRTMEETYGDPRVPEINDPPSEDDLGQGMKSRRPLSHAHPSDETDHYPGPPVGMASEHGGAGGEYGDGARGLAAKIFQAAMDLGANEESAMALASVAGGGGEMDGMPGLGMMMPDDGEMGMEPDMGGDMSPDMGMGMSPQGDEMGMEPDMMEPDGMGPEPEPEMDMGEPEEDEMEEMDGVRMYDVGPGLKHLDHEDDMEEEMY